MPHTPYHYGEQKTINWPKIILIALGILILIALVIYLIMNPTLFGKRGDNSNGNNNAGLGNNTYDCSADSYNCNDFTIQAEAQAVFDTCGPGDVHQLDRDGNGKACEGLE